MGGGEPSIFYRRSINNGTPDLRNRFVIGAVSDHQESEGSAIYAATNITGAASQTGGTKDAVVVAHNHSITDPGHDHTQNSNSGGIEYGSSWFRARQDTGYFTPAMNTASNTTGITGTNTTGESGLNKNLPPYYALAFIMRIS